jgi:ribonuclease P protein component
VLAAVHRLRRGDEFAAVIRGGRRAGRGAVVVHLRVADQTVIDQSAPVSSASPPTGADPRPEPARTPGAHGRPVRAGFVVSKAVGKAVVRNKVRRRLRHLVAGRLGRFPPGAMLVVRALPGAGRTRPGQLGADLDEALAAACAPRPPRSSRSRG